MMWGAFLNPTTQAGGSLAEPLLKFSPAITGLNFLQQFEVIEAKSLYYGGEVRLPFAGDVLLISWEEPHHSCWMSSVHWGFALALKTEQF
jgi:hypothetical protein